MSPELLEPEPRPTPPDRTDNAPEDPLDTDPRDEGGNVGARPAPWVILAVALLVLFVGLLAIWFVWPALAG